MKLPIHITRGDPSNVFLASELEKIIQPEAKANKMLPWSCNQITRQMQSGLCVIATDKRHAYGYAALLPGEKQVEICSIIVKEQNRRTGMGNRLFKCAVMLARELFPDKDIISLTNDISGKMAERIGFEEEPKSFFADEVWQECATCGEYADFPRCHCRAMVFPENTNVAIKEFNLPERIPFEDVAWLYCDIWKEPPWNENFWRPGRVQGDIYAQMRNRNAVFLYAQKNNLVIGFSWGYEVEMEEMRHIVGNHILDFLFYEKKNVFYVDELGVAKAYRKQKTAELLSRELIYLAGKKGLNRFLLRTDIKATAARSLYLKMGFEDMGIRDINYPDRSYWVLDT